MRLIDADALKKELEVWAVAINQPQFYSREEALYIIDSAPNTDAVPVVRCRECKHSRNCFIKEMIIAETKQDNPYCSCGAKKEATP
jgi:hypothetical protein